jgi:hypothetical protein
MEARLPPAGEQVASSHRRRHRVASVGIDVSLRPGPHLVLRSTIKICGTDLHSKGTEVDPVPRGRN